MKKDLHPTDNRPVVVRDTGTGFAFLTQSTAKTDKTTKWEDGNEYPLLEVYISSDSHPFYTGKDAIVDTEGRVERFTKRFGAQTSESRKQAAKSKKQPAGAKA